MLHHALVLGKFMPIHAGHVHLVETAARRAERVTVLVCTLLREPIPGPLRYAWARAALAHLPNVRVCHVDDEVPANPEDSPDFWAIWLPLMRRYTGPDLDAVFTSEAYGDELGRRLGVPHFLVDQARLTVPVSGTKIREQPAVHWAYLPPAARPYFCRRVALVGPESTGKTTLAAALAAAFQTTWVPEFARAYTVGRDVRELTTADLEAIARGQVALEETYVPQANRLLFCDTDALVTATWSELLLSTVPPAVEKLALAARYDLTLLLDIDLPWHDDGTRTNPHRRQWHFDRVRAWLERARRPYELLQGSGPTRLAQAVERVEAAFGWRCQSAATL